MPTHILKPTLRKIINRMASKLLTRKECSELLKVSLPTLHEWTKNGTVKGYRIGGVVRYKETEILDNLVQIQSTKYQRKSII